MEVINEEEFPDLKRKRVTEESIFSTRPTSSEMTFPNNPFVPKRDLEAVKFTCICFMGEFYTTDNDGFFLHKGDLYRCEMKENKEVLFTHIRSLNSEEMNSIEIVDDLNCIKDMTNCNTSLY